MTVSLGENDFTLAVTRYRLDNGHNIVIVGTWDGYEGTKESYTTEGQARRLKTRIAKLSTQRESLNCGDHPNKEKHIRLIDFELNFLDY
mgnify:FL=1|tara:strand:- start:752 stop:1018 length:267 start_codon:yes stop_codon:yes gene_type:complete